MSLKLYCTLYLKEQLLLILLGDDSTMQKSIPVGDLKETENTETKRVKVANEVHTVSPQQFHYHRA